LTLGARPSITSGEELLDIAATVFGDIDLRFFPETVEIRG